MCSKTNIYLVRHAESVANDLKRISGLMNIPLSEKGVAEATCLGFDFFLNKIYFDAIYSSNLERANRTAEIINDFQKRGRLVVKKEKNLNEMNFGNAEGYTFEKLAKIYPKSMKSWHELGYPQDIPGQESREEVADRMLQAIKDIAKKEENAQNICIVSHGMAILLLLAKLKEVGEKVKNNLNIIENAHYIKLEYDRRENSLTIK